MQRRLCVLTRCEAGGSFLPQLLFHSRCVGLLSPAAGERLQKSRPLISVLTVSTSATFIFCQVRASRLKLDDPLASCAFLFQRNCHRNIDCPAVLQSIDGIQSDLRSRRAGVHPISRCLEIILALSFKTFEGRSSGRLSFESLPAVLEVL
ncbi:uncharacterized protein LOC116263506 [Nymphaea colorata]|nr:uncharacterized protein LOC116263506 [Nymphaea colorata]